MYSPICLSMTCPDVEGRGRDKRGPTSGRHRTPVPGPADAGSLMMTTYDVDSGLHYDTR
jgi:hypothetical protein